MTLSAHDALLLLALLAAGAGLLALAPTLRVPYPILLVLGGLALGFVPGIPHPTLNPEIVLVAILPPLLYSSAFFTSLRDLRRNIRPLSLLAVGLVLVLGGVAIGLAVGFVIRQLRRRIDHSPTEIAIALFSGYFAYLPAEAAGVSAVLAAVTVGVYVGWYTPELTTVETRLQGDAVWEIVVFLLNGLLFALVGLQLRPILDNLSGRSPWSLVADGLIVSAAVIVTRFLWIYPGTYVPRALFR